MEQQDEQPGPRRLVGIDLGIASRHSVRVLEADGRAVCRASCVPTVQSLAAVEQMALAGAPQGTALAVVLSQPGQPGCRLRCSSPAGATLSTGCPRPRPRTCAGSCAGMPSRTG